VTVAARPAAPAPAANGDGPSGSEPLAEAKRLVAIERLLLHARRLIAVAAG
jgi:hypothetical protein